MLRLIDRASLSAALRCGSIALRCCCRSGILGKSDGLGIPSIIQPPLLVHTSYPVGASIPGPDREWIRSRRGYRVSYRSWPVKAAISTACAEVHHPPHLTRITVVARLTVNTSSAVHMKAVHMNAEHVRLRRGRV